MSLSKITHCHRYGPSARSRSRIIRLLSQTYIPTEARVNSNIPFAAEEVCPVLPLREGERKTGGRVGGVWGGGYLSFVHSPL